MKTMALAEETVRQLVHSKMRSVVCRSRPQSSAFTMRMPGPQSADAVCAQRFSGAEGPVSLIGSPASAWFLLAGTALSQPAGRAHAHPDGCRNVSLI